MTSYRGWHKALVPVNFNNSSFSVQATTLNDWLKEHVGRENFTFPMDQANGYWTFYLKNKEDAVRFVMVWL